MSAAVSELKCLVPKTLQEALQQRASEPEMTPIAGGTEVMVWLNDGRPTKGAFQSLHLLAPQLRKVELLDDGVLRIGALSTYTDVRFHPIVGARYPMLVESARLTGALQIQNRGTLAGNVANGSPAADNVPPLMAYDATVILASSKGVRTVSLDDFYLGYRKMDFHSDELIIALDLPRPVEGLLGYYRKVGTREAQAISKVVFAGTKSPEGGVKMVWGSVGPTTMRSRKTEACVENGGNAEEACSVLENEIHPIDDIRSTGEYRMKVAKNILKEFLKQ